jgi:phospholipid/cholesterol/gamma-HCH transport system ATP-binding protein
MMPHSYGEKSDSNQWISAGSQSDSAVIVQGLWKSFDGKEFILKGIDLQIKKGSLTSIIGFSGTGKSVIMKHIIGIHKPTKGRILVLGNDLSLMGKQALVHFRRKFGVLFQGSALFDDMTVLENVCFPLIEHRPELSEQQIIRLASEKLHQVGLEQKHHFKLPSEISGGMQKRTALARALALDPEILFYDEPTTGLDPILTELVDELILETHKSRPGLTSIMISHDLDAAFRLADFIVMLNAGKVLLAGTQEEFFASKDELVQKFLSKGLKSR